MENEQIQVPTLPELPLKGIPQEILRLGKRLADTKYQIDMLGKTGWGELTANLHGLEASGEWDGPDDALTFFSKIFPFAGCRRKPNRWAFSACRRSGSLGAAGAGGQSI